MRHEGTKDSLIQAGKWSLYFMYVVYEQKGQR
jgi:hypothetical protein